MADNEVQSRAWPTGPQAIHLVRTLQMNDLRLSQMADQKANMLMGATFLVFTLSIAQLREGRMLLPIVILATGAFAAAVLAILSVLPKVEHPEGPMPPEANLLFFGVATSMPEQEWADLVLARLATDETIFRTMLRDIYQNGQVLYYKKYRLLGYAYRTFLVGLVLSFAALAVELALTHL